MEQPRERSSALPLHFLVAAIEKGAFGSLSIMVANFTLLLLLMTKSETTFLNFVLVICQ